MKELGAYGCFLMNGSCFVLAVYRYVYPNLSTKEALFIGRGYNQTDGGFDSQNPHRANPRAVSHFCILCAPSLMMYNTIMAPMGLRYRTSGIINAPYWCDLCDLDMHGYRVT